MQGIDGSRCSITNPIYRHDEISFFSWLISADGCLCGACRAWDCLILYADPIGRSCVFVPGLSAFSVWSASRCRFSDRDTGRRKKYSVQISDKLILRASLTRSDGGSAWAAFSFEQEG